MVKLELNKQTFRDFQEGLKEIRKLKQHPMDEIGRKRFEKKWENNSVGDVLNLFLNLNSKD